MGSQAKRRREHRKKVNVNPKRARQKERRRLQPRVASDQLKAVWEEHRTVRRNIEGAGLLYDANKVDLSDERKPSLLQRKTEVVARIEEEAHAARRDRSFVLKDDMVFLAQMISRYGLDDDDECWAKMANDPDNHYQLTPKQIRQRFAKCQKVPASYNALMMACGRRPVPEGWSLEQETEQDVAAASS